MSNLSERLMWQRKPGLTRLFAEESSRLQALLLELPALQSEGSWQRSLKYMLQSQENPGATGQGRNKTRND